jgi:N-acetylmuramoyl-L-alanine amidase
MSGSYSSRENAEKQVQKLNASGFDATIMIVDK